MSSQCPTADRFAALLKDDLLQSERSSLEAHLEECLACREKLNALAGGADTWSNVASAQDVHEVEALLARLKPEEGGERIGPYKLLQQIGEGGFGTVWMAEQTEPVKRRVALKIIKLGMDTKEVIARFEQERQALAMMDHPNIAKVFDAGATQWGRPFFVMELVRGVPITAYCDEQKLPVPERLALFIQVCQALQHAHQKGIIHRDLKPSNVLVTAGDDHEPVPKVIDFGLAKAMDHTLTDKTLFTQFEQLIGTPAYMSPEQAGVGPMDIDTRSDIYSLGVLLYEMLTGKPPFDPNELRKAGHDEMRRVIREEEPPRPSTRLSTLKEIDLTAVATRRHVEPAKLASIVRGDLDWIVMKALEKNRNRRYETANGLGMDIRRHLNNEPVVARPPSRGYRFQKLVRRNKLAFAAAGAVAAALLIGLGVSSWMFFKEKEAHARALTAERQANRALANESMSRQRAEADEKKAHVEAQKSQQVTRFLKEMLKGVGPSVALGRDTRMLREILDNTADGVTKDLKEQPDIEAEILNDIGEVYRALGEYEKSERMHRQAMAIQIQLWGRDQLDVARSLHNLGSAILGQGQLAGAEEAYRDALRIRRKLLGEEHVDVADSLNALGNVRLSRGNISDAELLLRQALAMKRKLLVAEHSSIAATLGDLARLRQRQGKFAEAEPLLREALAIQTKVWGEDDLRVAALLGNLATTLASQGNLLEAEAKQRDALARKKKLFGKEHPAVAGSLGDLAGILQREGKLNDIEALFREELTNARERYPAYAAYRSDGIAKLLDVLLRQHELTKAEQLINEALTPALQAQPRNVGLLSNRAEFFARRSRWKDAAADFSRIMELEPANHNSWNVLAPLLVESGDYDAYRRHCQEMIARFRDTKDPLAAEKTVKACLLLPASGAHLEGAAKLAEKAVAIGDSHPMLPYIELARGQAEYRRGNFEEAGEWLNKSLSHGWSDANLNAPADLLLAMTHLRLGHHDKSRSALSKGAAIVVGKWPDPSAGDLRAGWNDLLIARILLREAKTLIEGNSETKAETK